MGLFGPGNPTARNTAEAIKQRQDARRAEDERKAQQPKGGKR